MNFKNPYSLYPTFTTANASGMSTEHYLRRHRHFQQFGLHRHPVATQNGTIVPFLERDQLLRDVDEQFSGGDTMNFTIALRPDFKAGYVDALPISNADVGVTAARLLGVTRKPNGKLNDRMMTEAMPNGATSQAFAGSVSSKPGANGLRTLLQFQRVLDQRYFDVAGYPGRTVGLLEETKAAGVQ